MSERRGGGRDARAGRSRTSDSACVEQTPRSNGQRFPQPTAGRGERGRRNHGSADATNWRRGSSSSADAPAKLPSSGDADAQLSAQLRDLTITHSKEEAVRGLCEAMCSLDEVRFRQRTNDISRFESNSSPSNKTATLLQLPLPWAVKKYRRPAAGRIEIQPKELRPPHVLMYTLQHLFTNVVPWTGCGFDWSSTNAAQTTTKPQELLALYHFVSDRVRSVRQDFVIQRVAGLSRIQALLQIARFHVLASFRAMQLLDVGDKTLDWSEPLNDQQLASALTEAHAQLQCAGMDAAAPATVDITPLREEALALDILLHLQDPRAVSLLLLQAHPVELLAQSAKIRNVLALFIAFQRDDYFQFVRCYRELPVLQQCLALRHLAALWPRALHIMNKAYGKIDRFPLCEIAHGLDLASADDARVLCHGLNVHVGDDGEPGTRPSAADSWDETSGEAARGEPRGFVQFKISVMRTELDESIMRELLRRKAVSIQSKLVCQSTATQLLLKGLEDAEE